MNTKPTLLFVNMRRIEKEKLESLIAAKNLGYDIVLLTNSEPKNELISFFKSIEIVDTFDITKSINKAKIIANKFNIVGVPSWTETDIELVALICAELNLPGLPISAINAARNKFAMKMALSSCSSILPKYRLIKNSNSLNDAINNIGFPAIIKPTGASGSKGIFVVRNSQEAHAALQKLQKIASPSFDPVFIQYGAEFIFEEYLEGKEFSVEGFVINKNIHIIGITDKWTINPYFLEYQHIFPAGFSENIKQDIIEKSTLIINKLGFNHCAFHLEAKMTKNGFRFIETAARLGGDYITSHLVRISTGLNMYSTLIDISVGNQPLLITNHYCYAGIRYILAPYAGRFIQLKGITDLIQNPLIEHLFFESNLNNQIQLPPKNFSSMRLAACIAKHSDYLFCKKNLDLAAKICIPQIGI